MTDGARISLRNCFEILIPYFSRYFFHSVTPNTHLWLQKLISHQKGLKKQAPASRTSVLTNVGLDSRGADEAGRRRTPQCRVIHDDVIVIVADLYLHDVEWMPTKRSIQACCPRGSFSSDFAFLRSRPASESRSAVCGERIAQALPQCGVTQSLGVSKHRRILSTSGTRFFHSTRNKATAEPTVLALALKFRALTATVQRSLFAGPNLFGRQ